MSYTYEELKKKTVAELREIAKGIENEAVKGYTQLNKEHLLNAICKALEIDTFVHHRAVVSDKSTIKRQIRELKKKREEALSVHNHTELKSIRFQIRHLKKKLRKAAV